MTGLLRAEVIKLLKRKLYWVMVAILGVLVGMTAAVLIALPRFVPESLEGFPTFAKEDLYVLGAQQVIGQTWFPLILAVIALAGELTTTAWASELARDARRWAHLAAKGLVVWLATVVAMLAAIAGWAVVTLLVAEGSGAPAASLWASLAWKTALIAATWVAIGLAVAALLKSQGVAIGVVLAFSFVEGILAIWKPYRAISLSTNSTAMLGDLDPSGGLGIGFGFFDPVPFAQALAVVVGWTIVASAAATITLHYRDA